MSRRDDATILAEIGANSEARVQHIVREWQTHRGGLLAGCDECRTRARRAAELDREYFEEDVS